MAGNKNSGRTNGATGKAVSRNQAFLNNRLRDMYGDDFDPVMKMSGNAIQMQKRGDEAVEAYEKIDDPSQDDLNRLFNILANCIEAWNKIAQYTNPKYRSIEFSSELGATGATLIEQGMSAQAAAEAYSQEILTK